MIHEAVTEIKTLLEPLKLIDLDVGKEINTHGNYLVFDGFKPDDMMASGVFRFTMFMALKSLKRGHKTAYEDIDECITLLGDAGEKNIVCECKNIELRKFSERLFIYAVQLELTRSW